MLVVDFLIFILRSSLVFLPSLRSCSLRGSTALSWGLLVNRSFLLKPVFQSLFKLYLVGLSLLEPLIHYLFAWQVNLGSDLALEVQIGVM